MVRHTFFVSFFVRSVIFAIFVPTTHIYMRLSGTTLLLGTALLWNSSAATTVMAQQPSDALFINEIQVCNNDQYLDNSYNYGAWIEIYNSSDTAVSLSRLYITADSLEYRLLSSQGSIPAKGFKVMWFDHNSINGNFGGKAYLQVPFKLSPEGGSVCLKNASKEIIDSVAYPQAVPRCSFARTINGAGVWRNTLTPSPGSSNAGSKFSSIRFAAPEVDTDSKVFTGEFQVRVTIPRGATLKYTTDGSTPSMTNGETSATGVFDIKETTILRCCLTATNRLPSPVVTRSYIYARHNYYLPILSISTDPKNLYDNIIGIYTKGTNGSSGNGQSSACNWNRDWERPVNMEYLTPSKNENGNTVYSPQINQEVDMEISGGWTRAYGGGWVDGKYWEMKSSFRLKTDKRYEGVNVIDYPVFPYKPHNKYKVWQVRNGGNDTYARITDPAIQQMVLTSGFYVDCQDYQPAHVFFNGEYLGMLNIRESNNKHYGYSNYGIDTDDMDQFDLSNNQYNQKVGDNKAWLELVKLSLQLASKKTPELYEQICQRLDIDEYTNYMALECYNGPTDWITNTNNVKAFRSRTDGKFHFVLFDIDSGFGSANMLNDVLGTSGGANVDDLFRNLVKYEPFIRRFVDAYCLVDGSVFEPSRCEEIVNAIYNNTNTALSFEGNNAGNDLMNKIRNAYNGSRITNLRDRFGLGTGYHLDISSNIKEARLLVNGQEIPTGKFSGYLFKYKTSPITLTAMAPAGYAFDGWTVSGNKVNESVLISQNSEWMYYDGGSMDSEPWTSASFAETQAGWKSGIAPFGYANEGKYMAEYITTKLDYGPNPNDKRPTYYFRNTFTLDTSLGSNDVLTFNYQVDDGMLLYVNGREVGSYFVDSGAGYSSYTSGGHYESDTPYYGTMEIPHEYLVTGKNQIAVMVKNTSATSTDIWFDASLVLAEIQGKSLSASSSIDITEHIDRTSIYTLKAQFSPIADNGKRLEAGASPIRINEVSAGNDIYISDYGKKSDWLELYNTTSEDLSLAGLYLSDNKHKPQKYRLPDEVIPAHGTRIIWCDGNPSLGQMHAPFKLSNADGSCVSIQAADGSWADRIDYMEQGKWQTYGRYPDGGNMHTILNQPTIDKTNRLGLSDFEEIADEAWQGTDIAITLALNEGWNWTSHNLNEDVDRTRFATYARTIRGCEEEYTTDEAGTATGELESLMPTFGYKLKMKQDADITLRGNIFDISTPVSLHEGWNWVGVPLYNVTTIEAALAELQAEDGDMIVGQDAFAVYSGGIWHGSLSAVSPGQAYMIRTGKAQTFHWNSLSPAKSRMRRYQSARQTQDAAWQTDIYAYPDVMTMVAEVSAEGDICLDGTYYVGAFVDGECRGVGVTEDGKLYMNIHGEKPDRIAFRLLDAEGECYETDKDVVFQSLATLGSHTAPYPLTFYTQDVLDDITPSTASDKEVRSVTYHNMAGQQVQHPSEGIYIKIVRYADGTTKVSKVRQ